MSQQTWGEVLFDLGLILICFALLRIAVHLVCMAVAGWLGRRHHKD